MTKSFPNMDWSDQMASSVKLVVSAAGCIYSKDKEGCYSSDGVLKEVVSTQLFDIRV